MKYTVTKRRGQWWVIDNEGYEVSYVGHDTKREALDAARVRTIDDKEATKIAAHF